MRRVLILAYLPPVFSLVDMPLNMSEIAEDVALLTHPTEALSWDSLSQRLPMDFDLAKQQSSRVLIGKLFGLKPPTKSVFLNILYNV